MQGPRGSGGPGRGMYVARRIVAALVVLLLLVLFVPWAFRVFSGPGEEPSTQAPPETTSSADVALNGGEETTAEETAAEETTASATEETVAEREATDDSTGDVEAVGDEGSGSPNVDEAAVDLTGTEVDLGEGSAVGEANTSQSAPVPPIDTSPRLLAQPIAFKQTVQLLTPKPVAPAPPVEPTAPAPPVEPTAPAPPVESTAPAPSVESAIPTPPVESTAPEPPVLSEEPATFYEEPVVPEVASFYEETVVPEVASVSPVTVTVGGTMATAGGGVAVASAGHR